MKKQLRFHQWALLYFAFFVGLLFFAIGLYQTFMGWQSQSWPKVSGAIHWVGRSWGYSYTVNGTTYRGTGVNYKGKSLNSKRVDKVWLKKIYPEGQPMEVYYWPFHPSFSVIDPGWGGKTWLFYLGGGVFMLVFGGQIWYFRSRSRS
jgi:hypothetical protein